MASRLASVRAELRILLALVPGVQLSLGGELPVPAEIESGDAEALARAAIDARADVVAAPRELQAPRRSR